MSERKSKAEGFVTIGKSVIFFTSFRIDLPTESIARTCVYAGSSFTKEEVTPKKEHQIARLILAVVYFLVSAIAVNVEILFASRLAPNKRLYKPPAAS